MVLTETSRYLRVIVDEVRRRMNAGETPDEIFHAVEPDAELAKRPFLRATYDHPKFIVRNLLRLWGGWWNGNAAELLPATPARQAEEIAALRGGVDKVIARGRALLDAGDATAASHLAEWATRAAPSDRDAQAFKRDVYARRLDEAESLMARASSARDARRAAGARRGADEHGRGAGMALVPAAAAEPRYSPLSDDDEPPRPVTRSNPFRDALAHPVERLGHAHDLLERAVRRCELVARRRHLPARLLRDLGDRRRARRRGGR
jgi:hypothetical protein